MPDIKHDDDVLGVVDLVPHPPVPGEAGAEYASEFFGEGPRELIDKPSRSVG